MYFSILNCCKLYRKEAGMEEFVEGDGELERWEHPDGKHPVRYQFTITTETADKPGIHVVATRRHGIGRVTSLSGEVFGEGEYRLFMAYGEVLKVFKTKLNQWEIPNW